MYLEFPDFERGNPRVCGEAVGGGALAMARAGGPCQCTGGAARLKAPLIGQG